jgi:hypothetical protein
VLVLNDIMEKFSSFTIPKLKQIMKKYKLYSITRKHTSFHSHISKSLMIFG